MRLKITMDCHDLDRQAAFWCAATDYARLPGWAECYVNLRPTGDRSGRPDFLLQRVPEGKQAKNRLHIDLHPDDGPATVVRLEGLGAVRLGPVDTEFMADHSTQFQVMGDPEGNEFCVVWRLEPAPWD